MAELLSASSSENDKWNRKRNKGKRAPNDLYKMYEDSACKNRILTDLPQFNWLETKIMISESLYPGGVADKSCFNKTNAKSPHQVMVVEQSQLLKEPINTTEETIYHNDLKDNDNTSSYDSNEKPADEASTTTYKHQLPTVLKTMPCGNISVQRKHKIPPHSKPREPDKNISKEKSNIDLSTKEALPTSALTECGVKTKTGDQNEKEISINSISSTCSTISESEASPISTTYESEHSNEDGSASTNSNQANRSDSQDPTPTPTDFKNVILSRNTEDEMMEKQGSISCSKKKKSPIFSWKKSLLKTVKSDSIELTNSSEDNSSEDEQQLKISMIHGDSLNIGKNQHILKTMVSTDDQKDQPYAAEKNTVPTSQEEVPKSEKNTYSNVICEIPTSSQLTVIPPEDSPKRERVSDKYIKRTALDVTSSNHVKNIYESENLKNEVTSASEVPVQKHSQQNATLHHGGKDQSVVYRISKLVFNYLRDLEKVLTIEQVTNLKKRCLELSKQWHDEKSPSELCTFTSADLQSIDLKKEKAESPLHKMPLDFLPRKSLLESKLTEKRPDETLKKSQHEITKYNIMIEKKFNSQTTAAEKPAQEETKQSGDICSRKKQFSSNEVEINQPIAPSFHKVQADVHSNQIFPAPENKHAQELIEKHEASRSLPKYHPKYPEMCALKPNCELCPKQQGTALKSSNTCTFDPTTKHSNVNIHSDDSHGQQNQSESFHHCQNVQNKNQTVWDKESALLTSRKAVHMEKQSPCEHQASRHVDSNYIHQNQAQNLTHGLHMQNSNIKHSRTETQLTSQDYSRSFKKLKTDIQIYPHIQQTAKLPVVQPNFTNQTVCIKNSQHKPFISNSNNRGATLNQNRTNAGSTCLCYNYENQVRHPSFDPQYLRAPPNYVHNCYCWQCWSTHLNHQVAIQRSVQQTNAKCVDQFQHCLKSDWSGSSHASALRPEIREQCFPVQQPANYLQHINALCDQNYTQRVLYQRHYNQHASGKDYPTPYHL